ncbi:MAG: aminotransferase class V-fold PLP-dependent enzyme, partial [Acidimicrobiia bacterium]|nr:aminotransferase class V-fold PLP-dependent enzyme [Acidimicrobiia bacterium]
GGARRRQHVTHTQRRWRLRRPDAGAAAVAARRQQGQQQGGWWHHGSRSRARHGERPCGGGQELGRRSGTHDVAGAVGLAAALAKTVEDRAGFRARVDEIRSSFEERVRSVAQRTVPVGHTLIQHSHLRFPGRRNETLLVRLDQLGVAASAASACQSGATTVSHVLAAMDVEDPREHLRFSFGWNSTMDDADAAAAAVLSACEVAA